MKYTTLPNTDVKISKICLGTMNWGQQNTEAEAHEQLDYAIGEGVTFIDTAEAYPIPPEPEKQGRTENYIGNWLKKRGKRDDLIIGSKVNKAPFVRTRATTGHYDKKNIFDAIDGTLQRLQTDYVDLYQIHWPERKTNVFGIRSYEHDPADESTPIEETLEVLSEVVKSGKVRYLGVSNETPWGVHRYLLAAETKNLPRIITIQNQYSLLNRTFEIGLAEMSIKEKIGLLAYSPLSAGVLTGKYVGGARPEGARFTLTERNAPRYNAPRSQKSIEKYVELAKKYGLDPAQMGLAFVRDRQFTTAVIVGATSVEQLKTDIASVDVELSPEVMEGISAIYEEMPDPHA